jgi:hypothetical protein
MRIIEADTSGNGKLLILVVSDDAMQGDPRQITYELLPDGNLRMLEG